MRTNLILVEHEEQVKDLHKNQWSDNPTWVAVGPSAVFELEQSKTPFIIPEDYYQPENLRLLGSESHLRVQKVCSTIDELLRRSVVEVQELGLNPTLYSLYPLTIAMDTLALRIFQIKHLISEIHPQVITVHSSSDYPSTISGIGFDNRESLYGRVLGLNGWEVNVNMVPEVPIPKNKERRATTIYKYLKVPIMKTSLLYNAILHWRYMGLKSLEQRLSKMMTATVCVYGGRYDWSNVVHRLYGAGLQINFLTNELGCSNRQIVDKKKQGYLLKELEENVPFRNLLTWNGVDTYPLMKQRIAYLVKENVNQVIHSYELASRIFKKRSISALLTSAKGESIDHAICLAAQHNNIPVFNWQHGSAGYYEHDTLEFFDFLTTDVYLSYGEGVCQSMKEKSQRYQVFLKPVGSVSLDNLRNQQKTTLSKSNLLQRLHMMRRNREKLCLYATTNYFQNNWYASYDPPPSDILFYQTQTTLTRELSKYPGLGLIFKLSPSPSRKPPWIDYFRSQDSVLIIYDECTFTDLLGYSDLIILDWPSTTLLQAIATHKPVFVMMKHLRLFPEARQMLERRAVCADEPMELVNCVQEYLTTTTYSADINDNVFIKRYGTHLDDGHSDERSVEEVLKTIKRRA